MSQTNELKDLIQLKKHLYQLKQCGDIPQADYVRLNQEIDQLSFQIVDDLSPSDFPTLVSQLKNQNPQLQLRAFDPLLTKQRLNDILSLRRAAGYAGKDRFEAESLFPGVKEVPLSFFSWIELADRYTQLIDELVHEDSDEGFLQTLRKFMGESPREQYLLGLKSLRTNTLVQLSQEKLIDAPEQKTLMAQDEQLRNALVDREQILKTHFVQGNYDEIYRYTSLEQFYGVFDALSASEYDVDLLSILLTWQGPELHRLFDKALASSVKNPKLAEISVARIGIDPYQAREKWLAWVAEEQARAKQEMAIWETAISKNRLLYDVLVYVATLELVGADNLDKHTWLRVARRLLQPVAHTTKQDDALGLENDEQRVQKGEQQSKSEKALKDFESESQREEQESLHEALEVDEISTLTAPEQQLSHADKVVQKNSPWNEYLKPFLSENWLGLMGIALILAAWPILSMMVWDMGPYYRLAAGAIPLLLMTLGSAWITQFFARLKNEAWDKTGELQDFNRKPVQLFSCLTIWTLPFNYLMAISLFEADSYIVGILLLFVYAGLVSVISPWLSSAFTSRPQKYLLISHSLLLIPSIFNAFNEGWLVYGLALLTFASFFLFVVAFLQKLEHSSVFGRSFYLILFGVHAFLLVASNHIYFKQLPSIYTFALLAQFIALTLMFLYEKRQFKYANLLVVGGALTFLGVILSFGNLVNLLAVLVLSCLFWFALFFAKKKKQEKFRWIAEVFALHPLAIGLTLYLLFGLSVLGSLMLGSLIAAFLAFMERKVVENELKVISYLLPPGLLITGLVLPSLIGLSYILFPMLLGVVGLYYLRAQQLYSSKLWFLAVITGFLLPLLIFRPLLNDWSYLALYLSLGALAWACLDKFLRRGVAKQHMTTVLSGLMCLALVPTALDLISNEFHVDFAWLFSALCLVGVAIVTAKRTESALPIYLASAIIATLVIGIKHQLDYQSSKSGLGSATLALLFIVLAPKIQKLSWLQAWETPDRWFNRQFWFKSKLYLRNPIEQASWVLLALSFAKALMLFQPLIDNFKISLALGLQVVGLTLLAVRYRMSWVFALSFAPSAVLAIAIVSSLPYVYQPLLAMLMLLGLLALHNRVTDKEIFFGVMNQPLKIANAILSTLFVVAGVLAYLLMIVLNSGTLIVALFGGLALLYVHLAFVHANRYRFVHLSVVHLVILWTLAFIQVAAPAEEDFLVMSMYFAIGLFLVLFILAYSFEWFENPSLKAYRERAQAWLWFVAIGMTALAVLPFLDWNIYADEYHQPLVLLIALVCMHLANRYYHGRVLLLAKWLVSWSLSFVLLDDIFLGVLSAIGIFLSFELMWHVLSKKRWLQIQGVGDYWKTPHLKIAHITLIALASIILVHWLGVTDIYAFERSPFWLFILVPLSLYIYKTLEINSLAYLVAFSFIYSNVFVVISWQWPLDELGLSTVHLVCMGLLVSIVSFSALLRLTRWSRQYGPEQSQVGVA